MAQRTNIRRRGNTWVVYFRVNRSPRPGARSTRTATYGSTSLAREEAELYLAQSQVKLRQGSFRKATRMRFSDFAIEWLQDYAKGNVRERTFETYGAALRNHLIPHFGDLLLTQITRKLIDAFVADWLAGGRYYQDRLRAAREIEARSAAEERRNPRPIYLSEKPGTISNTMTPLREMLGRARSSGSTSRRIRPQACDARAWSITRCAS